MRRILPWIALGALAFLTFFAGLGSSGMYAAQEGRAGIIARNMVASGNYLDLQFKGRDTNEKPVLFYWLCLGGAKIFGFNEFGIRFPAALAAALSVMGTALLGRRIYGEKAGLLAGMMLACMPGFMHLGRIARIDIVLGAFYLWSMYLLYRGYFENMKPNWRLYAFYLVLGLSVLVKGPVSAALAGFGAVLFACVMRDWRVLWELKPISGLFIGLAASSPWFIYEGMKTGGEYTTQFLVSHNVKRFLGIDSEYGGGKKKTVFFYIPNLLGEAMPWILLGVAGVLDWWRRRKTALRPQTWFLICWFAAVFIFFSLSAYKRGDYLAPLYPCLAILLARSLTTIEEKRMLLPKLWIWIWGAVALALAGALTVIFSGLATRLVEPCLSDKVPFVSERDARSGIQIFDFVNARPGLSIFAALIAIAALFVALRLFEKGKAVKGAICAAALFFAAHMSDVFIVQPYAVAFKTLRDHVLAYKASVPQGAMTCQCRVENLEEIIFYLDRDYEEIWKTDDLLKKDGSLAYDYLVIRESTYENEVDQHVKDRYEVVERTPEGHQYPTLLCKAKGLSVKRLREDFHARHGEGKE